MGHDAHWLDTESAAGSATSKMATRALLMDMDLVFDMAVEISCAHITAMAGSQCKLLRVHDRHDTPCTCMVTRPLATPADARTRVSQMRAHVGTQ